MKNMKRLTALLLAALLALQFTACGNDDDGKKQSGGETTAPPTLETTEGQVLSMKEERALVQDKLPAMNFDGATFTALLREGQQDSFYSAETSGDNVETALYSRDRNVSERFNVALKYNFIPGGWGDQNDYFAYVNQNILGDTKAFMLAACYAATASNLALNDLAYNLNELTYLDTESPWWFGGLTEELTINDKCFFVSGDLSLYSWYTIQCIYFNKKLAENYQVGDLYATVNDGKWSLDKIVDITKGIYSDVNNDGIKNVGDSLGLATIVSNNIDAMAISLDCMYTVKDSDGYPQINLDNPRFVDMAEKLYSFLYESDGILCVPETAEDATAIREAFQGDEALLYTATFSSIQNFRSMDTDFGILPYPKYDEAQEEYKTMMGDAYDLFWMPINIGDDADFASIITEALCAENYRLTIPEYYEVALKSKGARDDDSQEMIDLIRETLTFNFGAINSTALATGGNYGPAQLLRISLKTNKPFVSTWEAAKKGIEAKLEELLEAYE